MFYEYWCPFWNDLVCNIWLILLIVYMIWIYSWLKSNTSSKIISAGLTILFVWLLFIQYPELVWVPLALYLIANIIGPFIEKVK